MNRRKLLGGLLALPFFSFFVPKAKSDEVVIRQKSNNGEGTTYYKKIDGYHEVHREDGPAYIFKENNGYECESWYFNGELHRLNGPAFSSNRGFKHYYIHGKELTEQEFNQIIKR